MTRKARVLVVEDQDNERRAMARLLKMEGYDALMAKNADEALSRIAEPISLVITDLKMPDASGVELLQQWKRERPTTPFLMVTAYAEVDSAVAAMKLGAKDYLTKPVKPEEFLDLVARVVSEEAETAAGEPIGSSSHSADAAPPSASPVAGVRPAAEATRLEDLEKDTVLRVLKKEGGNRTHAARLLGISIRTLQRKLKAWGLAAQGEAPGDISDDARPNDRNS